jgi:hypothetical protein
MNMSLQIGRGLAALALCAAVSAFAITRPASQPVSDAAQTRVSASAARVMKLHAGKEQKRCAVAIPNIEVGAPIAITIDSAPLATAGR